MTSPNESYPNYRLAGQPAESQPAGASAGGNRASSPRASWRHDSGDEQILARATAMQQEAIRRAREAATQVIAKPVAPTMTMPQGAQSGEKTILEQPVAAGMAAPTQVEQAPQSLQQPVPQQPAMRPRPDQPRPARVILPEQQDPQEAEQPDEAACRPLKAAKATVPSIALIVLVALLAASLPTEAALIGAVLVWLLGARGRSVSHQHLREQERGGFRRNSDGFKEGARTPLYLLQALPAAIGSLLLCAVLYAIADLLVVGLLGGPSTPLVLSLPTQQTLSVPLIAGSGTSLGALALALAAAGASAIVFFRGLNLTPVKLGLAALWLAVDRGLCRIFSRESSLTEPLGWGQDGVGGAYPAGYEAYGGGHGYGSPQEVRKRTHGGEILGIILLAIFVTALIAAAIHLGSPIDWTPIVTGSDAL